MEPVVLWTDGTYRCVLHRIGGRYEVHFHDGSRVFRAESAATEAEARRKVAEWLRSRPDVD
jgi:hypothetical protein